MKAHYSEIILTEPLIKLRKLVAIIRLPNKGITDYIFAAR